MQVNVIQILNRLKPGGTIAYQQVYIGDKQQLFSRLIFHLLTTAQLQKRLKKIAKRKVKIQNLFREK